MKITTVLKNEFDRIGLTAKEREVSILLLDFYNNKEIGNIICICENSVKYHLTHIYRKVGLEVDNKPYSCKQQFMRHFYSLLCPEAFIENKVENGLPRSMIK